MATASATITKSISFSSHYDSVARVPLVFAGPGVERLGTRDPLVELIDLGPTLLEVAGLGPLVGAAGLSLGPLLHGEEAVLHETVFSEYGPRIMARTEAWKLVFLPRGTLRGVVSFRRGPGRTVQPVRRSGSCGSAGRDGGADDGLVRQDADAAVRTLFARRTP